MHVLVAAVVLLAGFQEKKNEAEELFKKMEDTLAKAKTLQLRYDAKIEGEDKSNAKGELLIGEGNRIRMKFDVTLGSKPGVVEVISDGSKTVTVTDGKASDRADAKKNMRDVFCVALARSGFTMSLLMTMPEASGGKEPDPRELQRTSDFKLGKKEKIGEDEAQAIEFKLDVAGLGATATTTVWVDVKTSLPRKRVIELKSGGAAFAITESYSDMKLDEKIDDAKFALP